MVTLTLKKLNNKSRKGLYYYVKEKGYRGQYYKTDPTNMLEEEEILYYYINKHVLKKKEFNYAKNIRPKKGLTKQKTKEKIKGKSIAKILKKARGEVTIYNAHKASEKKIHNHIQKLLKNVIKNEEFRKKLSKHEQMKKYSQHVTHSITFYNNKNNKLLVGKAFNKTSYKLIKDLQKRNIIEDEYDVEDGYKKVIQKLKYVGMKGLKGTKSGTIHHYNIKITLRA